MEGGNCPLPGYATGLSSYFFNSMSGGYPTDLSSNFFDSMSGGSIGSVVFRADVIKAAEQNLISTPLKKSCVPYYSPIISIT